MGVSKIVGSARNVNSASERDVDPPYARCGSHWSALSERYLQPLLPYVLGCGFLYDERLGLPEHSIRAGTRWADIPGGFDLIVDGLARLLRQLKPDGPTGLLPPHRGAIDRIAARWNVRDPKSDDIAAL